MRSYMNTVFSILSLSAALAAGRDVALTQPVDVCPRRAAPPATCPHCPRLAEPVCSTEGCSYTNECFLDCDGVKMSHTGTCFSGREETRCDCPDEYSPTCATDGVTHTNPCYLKCSGKEAAHPGQCTNLKSMHREDQHLAHEGHCSGDYDCLEDYQPMCTNKGTTVLNPCFLSCMERHTLEVPTPTPTTTPTAWARAGCTERGTEGGTDGGTEGGSEAGTEDGTEGGMDGYTLEY